MQAQSAATQAQQDAKQAHLGVGARRSAASRVARRAFPRAGRRCEREEPAQWSARSVISHSHRAWQCAAESGPKRRRAARLSKITSRRSAELKAPSTSSASLSGLNTLLYRKGQEVGRTTIAVSQPVSAIQGEISLFPITAERPGSNAGAHCAAQMDMPFKLLKIAFARNPVNPGSDQGDSACAALHGGRAR